MWKICKIGPRLVNLGELGEKNQKLQSLLSSLKALCSVGQDAFQPPSESQHIKSMFNINVSDRRIKKGINVSISKAYSSCKPWLSKSTQSLKRSVTTSQHLAHEQENKCYPHSIRVQTPPRVGAKTLFSFSPILPLPFHP